MSDMVSPGIQTKEIDLTTSVAAVSTSVGGTVGHFKWGPAEQRTLISNETALVSNFGEPDANTASDFFTAANFLSYSNALYVVRALNDDATNAIGSANTDGFVVKNEDDYEENGVDTGAGNWIAKYPGEMGNSLYVSSCSSADAWESDLTGTVDLTFGSKTVTGTGTAFDDSLVGEYLRVPVNGFIGQVAAVANTTSLTLTYPYEQPDLADASAKRRWKYYPYFDAAPGTSSYADDRGGSGDEIHVIVIDQGGKFSGSVGSILERHSAMSMGSDAKDYDNSSIYYKDVINNSSSYIWFANHDSSNLNAGETVSGTAFAGQTTPEYIRLEQGSDGGTPSAANYIDGWTLFKSKEDVDVSILMAASATQVLSTSIINNVAETRLDCVVCVSPPKSTCVNNATYAGKQAEDVVDYRNTLPSSSYAVIDGNWKYQYDKYNDVYRWVPLNGDIGGLMARTDDTRDPWYSPAGFNRGNIKNVVKLAYNPKEAERDVLYKSGVNPVVSFDGLGTVLYGDKTMQSISSAFDRINVRRLFNTLKKAISRASNAQLFELNTETTRSQFVNMVTPYLREVQGREGITDFDVVCDETNNTDYIIDTNQFVGTIKVKPSRSINFITLNFVATQSGVEFSEVASSF